MTTVKRTTLAIVLCTMLTATSALELDTELESHLERHRVGRNFGTDWKQWDALPDCDKEHVGLQWNKPYNCVECMLRRKETKDLEAFYQWWPC